MKMKDRKEDRLFKADLTVSGFEEKGIACRLFLPERIYEKPYCIFHPERKSAASLMLSYLGEMKADIYDMGGELSAKIESPKVYLSSASTKIWAKDILETTISAEPQDLYIVQYLRGNAEPTKKNIVFWISNSRYLSPAIISEISYTGDVKNERVGRFEFLIGNKTNIVFDRHFKNKNLENNDQMHWSFLVGSVDVDDCQAENAYAIKNGLLADIDDFLLVVSFAERARVACLGWSANDSKSMSTFYRGDYTFPEERKEDGYSEGVVDVRGFQEFVDTCYDGFSRFGNKHSLRSSMHAAIGAGVDVLEMTFLRTFAGLESLILDYRRKNDIEFILNLNDWKSLRAYLQGCIKRSDNPSINAAQRDSIYRKLGELNRVSLSEAFDLFCKEYCLDLSDLWPVFSQEKGQPGLVDIRNRLVHGDPLPSAVLHQLAVAMEHLKYTLERTLVRILGFDVAKTNVAAEWLRQCTAILGLAEARKEIAGHIDSA